MKDSERIMEVVEEDQVLRMSLHMRVQHFYFGICVLMLALTGLGLLFYDTGFGRWLIALEGGFHNRGLIHRVAAIGLTIGVIYHLAYSLLTSAGLQEFRLRMIGAGDVKDFAASVRIIFGSREKPPALGKYSPGQKVHYWLAGFMAVTLILSGVALWDRTASMTILPQWTMMLVRIVHGYEGLLVFIVIVIWHIYDIHLSPGNFPMSKVWLTGRMPLQQLKKYHRKEYDQIIKSAQRDHE